MARLSYKSLFIILLFLLIGIIGLLRLNQKPHPAAAWWNDGWNYRRALSIGNSNSAQTDIQIKLLDNYDLSTLVTAGKIQTDLDDLRFTDVNGKVLNYWIEDSTNSSVDIWGIIPSVPNGGAIIYMYYGNPSATSVSSTTNITIGGTMASVGGYRIHTFKGSDTLTNAKTENAEVLVVAGGGGGGSAGGVGDGGAGGGGAGGLTYNSSYSLTSGQTINVTVGIGGSASAASLRKTGTTGGNSTFGSITVTGGGGGGPTSSNGQSGGSGGGGGYNGYSTVRYGGAGTVGIGNSGGNTSQLSWAGGAGGGGAGGIGGDNKINHNGGDGGLGLNYTISGIGVTYATGGRGGGGESPVSKTANTGNGGDGAYSNATPTSGASGIVIVRYSSGTAASPATEEVGGGPIAYWKFDEGVGTTAYDSTSNLNNGVLGTGNSAPTWQTEDQCISGKCLYFDGSNDYLNATKITVPTNITISMWVNPNSYDVSPTQNPRLFHLFDGTNDLQLILRENGKLVWGSAKLSQGIGLTTLPPLNSWTYITAVKSNTSYTVYYNGVLQTSSATVPGDPAPSTQIIRIGANINGSATNGHFKGFIDEVKIYPYARTATQIKSDYNSRNSNKGSSANLGSTIDNLRSLSDGLVGYWKFDENTGAVTTDSSGVGNSGAFGTGSSAPTWSTGKYGVGLSFDGNIDYVQKSSFSNFPSTEITTSFWIKTADTGDGIISYASSVSDNNDFLIFTSSNLSFYVKNIGVTTGISVSDNSWHNIIATWKSSGGEIKVYKDGVLSYTGSVSSGQSITSSGCLVFGQEQDSVCGSFDSTQAFNGNLDEVRIYNRALSPNEVSQLYNWAPGPVAYWDFNENIGTTTKNKTNNNNNFTFNAGSSAPTWVNGKYGSGLKFNGNNNWLETSLSPSIPASTNYTQSLWFYPTSAADGILIDDYNRWEHYIQMNSDRTVKACYYNSAFICTTSTSTVNLNTWNYVTAVVESGSSIKLYLNGTLWAQNTSVGSTQSRIIDDVIIGAGGSTHPTPFTGIIDDVKIYNYARTQKQIVEDMNAGHPAGGSPVGSQVGYWKFDEGYGSIINNIGNGGIGLSGVFGTGTSAPTWTNNGKFGKALSFDGANDNIQIPYSSSLAPTSGITFGAWVYKSNWTSDEASRIISKTEGGGYTLLFSSSSIYAYVYRNGDYATPNYSTTGLSAGWHHFVGSYDGQYTKIYVDGILRSTNNAGANYPITYAYSNALFIGAEADSDNDQTPAGNFFNGLIDEVKIYNYALTDDEIKIDYNRGVSTQLGSLSSGTGNTAPATAASQEYCVPGDTSTCSAPINEWKFEEKTGSTAYDSSGSNNHGTIGSGSSAPTWTPGKIGSALKFDGVNNRLPLTSTINLRDNADWTVSAWVKTSSSGTNSILSNSSGGPVTNDVRTASSKISYSHYTTTWLYEYGNTNIADNKWHYLTWVNHSDETMDMYVDGVGDTMGVNSSQSSGPVNQIGRNWGTTANATIDQVRIYNYARSPAQIAWEYNKGGPIGWWKLDECQGNIANDSSGVGNTGTITIGSSGTQNSLGTCAVGTSAAWTNGATGKYNSSLNFDGTDDNVNIGDPTNGSLDFGTNDFSTSAWIKTSSSQQGVIVGKYSGYPLFYSRLNADGKIESRIGFDVSTNFTSTDGTTVNDNSWHQIVTVYKRDGNMTRYLDGKIYGSALDISSASSTTVNTSNSLIIGSGTSSQYFTGQIDDVRIYNYALTDTQIKTLYNNGAVSFTGN